jgi:hypothetical protein
MEEADATFKKRLLVKLERMERERITREQEHRQRS